MEDTASCGENRDPEGGKGAALGDQEAVGGDAQCGVMVEAAPPPALFIIAQAKFLLELPIIALDAPAQLCQIDQTIEGGVLVGSVSSSGHSIRSPSSARNSLSKLSRCAGRTLHRTKREESQSAVPSRQVIVCSYATFGIGSGHRERGGARDEAAISNAGRKRILGSALAVLGVMVWAMSATLGLASNDHRDVSISHFEELSLGVIAGGAAVVGGIILLATAV